MIVGYPQATSNMSFNYKYLNGHVTEFLFLITKLIESPNAIHRHELVKRRKFTFQEFEKNVN